MVVGARWPAAVKALSMAIWIEVSFALGMRVKCRRCRVESTRAMLKSVYEVREVESEGWKWWEMKRGV